MKHKLAVAAHYPQHQDLHFDPRKPESNDNRINAIIVLQPVKKKGFQVPQPVIHNPYMQAKKLINK